jgi:T-complex protein 11
MKGELQERAVANEREYFQDRIAKRKLDLNEVIDWIKPSFESDSTNRFASFSNGTFSFNSTLIIAFVNLLIPSAEISLPSTFLFDFARLNNFKKDFRDLISMQLCLLLYRELSVSLHSQNTPPTNSSFNALRLEIWSLLCEHNDLTKYTLTSESLAIQIALRASQHANPNTSLPPSHLVKLAQSWIDLNVSNPTSKIFTLAEVRVTKYLVDHIISSNGTSPQTALRGCECEGKIVWATGTETAMWLLAERMHRVAAFHWAVFGDIYIDSIN